MKEARKTTKKIQLKGKTLMANAYVVTIAIEDDVITDITISGKPNLFVEDTGKSFARKRPKNVKDVVAVIKLEMIKRGKFIEEVDDG